MDNYIISLFITIIFTLIQCFRLRDNIKEDTTYKPLLKDIIIVFVSCILGLLCIEFFEPDKVKTKAYTDNPSF